MESIVSNYNSIKMMFAKIGVDRAIGYTILSRLVQAGGSFFVILFIARFLTKVEQGYYYTFTSILALQIFFELGLSSIITQYAAHEFAYLKIDNRVLDGNAVNLSRLSSLLKYCIKWFSSISIMLFVTLLLVGLYFFQSFSNTGLINWRGPWCVLCIATSLNLMIDPILAFFDGIGFINDISKVRLVQKTMNILLLFVFLIAGFGLYSAALALLLSTIINYLQILLSPKLDILKSIWKINVNWKINYSKEIFPYQWKIALSWISGFFIFYFFNPILFATEGPIIAGQMGMTLAVLNGISSISMSWINTKVPLFSTLIAKKQFVILSDLVRKTIKQLSIINFIFLAAFIFGVIIVNNYYLDFKTRFLPIIPMLLLCLATFVNQFISSWATYLRCYKKEPFLALSVIMAALCTLSTVFLGKRFGVLGIVTGYTTIICIISLPWAYFIYKRKILKYQM